MGRERGREAEGEEKRVGGRGAGDKEGEEGGERQNSFAFAKLTLEAPAVHTHPDHPQFSVTRSENTGHHLGCTRGLIAPQIYRLGVSWVRVEKHCVSAARRKGSVDACGGWGGLWSKQHSSDRIGLEDGLLTCTPAHAGVMGTVYPGKGRSVVSGSNPAECRRREGGEGRSGSCPLCRPPSPHAPGLPPTPMSEALRARARPEPAARGPVYTL